MYEEVIKQWLDAIVNIDREGANEIIHDWIIEHGKNKVFTEILRPALEELGKIWTEQGDITFAQVYVATTIAEDVIVNVYVDDIPSDQKKPKVILGNIEDDFHSLGRRMVSSSLKSSGWQVIDLGTDIPAEEFLDSAIAEGANIIMISAMLYSTALNIKKVREEINKRGYKDKIHLVVGGAIFNVKENLWKEVGADAMGKSALDAGKIAERLLMTV